MTYNTNTTAKTNKTQVIWEAMNGWFEEGWTVTEVEAYFDQFCVTFADLEIAQATGIEIDRRFA